MDIYTTFITMRIMYNHKSSKSSNWIHLEIASLPQHSSNLSIDVGLAFYYEVDGTLEI